MDVALIERINSYYGLSAFEVKVIERLMFRKNYLIQNYDNKRYIVKYYSTALELFELTQVWQYYILLSGLGIAVGCPLRRKDTHEFQIGYNNGYYVVFEYLEGNNPEANNYLLVANSLRDYHSVASVNLIPGLVSTQEKLRCAESIFPFFYQNSYQLKDEILSCEDEIYDIVHSFFIDRPAIIHGDTILENMIYDKHKVCLIDFDSMRIGDALEDVANTVLSIFYYGSSTYEMMSVRYQYVSGFLDSYFNDVVTKDLLCRLHYLMKVHCVIELARHAENIKYLIRMPGMKPYLRLLIKVINSKDFYSLTS
jgi:hypothetical protein